MKERIIHLLARLSLGKQLAAALMILRLIVEAVREKDAANVARFVYRKLPASWRHPEGPATEAEFLEMIASGEQFLKSVRNLAVH